MTGIEFAMFRRLSTVKFDEIRKQAQQGARANEHGYHDPCSEQHGSRQPRSWLILNVRQMKRTITSFSLLLASCSHHPPPIPVIEFSPKASDPRPPVSHRASPISIDVLKPDIVVDLNRLDLEGFFPPGSERIGSIDSPRPDLSPATRVRFPSVEVARSSDQQNILFHDGLRRGTQIHHRLMLLSSKKEDPTTVYGTSRTFDVIWAPNSRHFAITTYSGENSSEIAILGIDGERHAVNLRAIIQAHFPSHVWEAPMFLKAYHWTTTSDLVLRCIGRSSVAPFDVFGCESIAHLSGDAVTISFSRGFMKWSASAERIGGSSTFKTPNKAPEPTPTAVTSPAAQEPRQP